MDPLSSLALTVVLAALSFYVLYQVIYRAVLNALRQADRDRTGGGDGLRHQAGHDTE